MGCKNCGKNKSVPRQRMPSGNVSQTGRVHPKQGSGKIVKKRRPIPSRRRGQ
tara:strand:+ start:694 stop:849 length:156 start_codon:yes stop_codon:yes gene_type:complete